jgi:hypothetical protein
MLKKLNIDSLSSEAATVRELLVSAQEFNDIVGEMQLEHRLNKLECKITELKETTAIDNNASVALFFGGQPVVGSKGIAAEFAGVALEQFQNLVGKVFATNELGELGQRGKVPFKANSGLMVTGLARGSFGFVLDEMSEQLQLESSKLTNVIDKTSRIIRDSAAQDEEVFETLLEDLDTRSLIALKDFFTNLDTNKATIRIVEKDLDFTLNSNAIHRARMRTEATSIEEDTNDIKGTLIGFLPEHGKFELRDNDNHILYGSVSKEAVEQFKNETSSAIGKQCLVKVTVRTVAHLNRAPKEVTRLVEFLEIES